VVVTHALQLLIKGKSLAGPALKKAGDGVAGLTKKVADASSDLSRLGNIGKTAFKALAVGATAAATAVVALVTAFIGLPAAIGAATSKLTDYAAELDLARDAMWAITGDAMPAMMQSLREATAFMTTEKDILREYHMAYMLLGQDLATRVPEAMQYLTKVAALTGDTVEYLTSRLVRSVGRLSTRWMAYIGTVVTVEEAEARAAEMFGLTTDELSYQQKQAGMLDRVLAKLAARTSILPEVMGTTKQMSEALKVSWKELWAEVTTHLLPVASGLYKILLRSVVAWKALVTQGGALYGPIRKVTATFTVLLEILGDLLDKALEVEEGATSALERFADNVISMAWKAVQWGSNIAVNLAIGIVKGASVALIGAMNFISGLLAHWLAPGSAPLVVSNILDWGASAFTEFLRGFSMADFDILEGIQGPLKRALSVLVKLDELGEIEAGEYFIELSEMMAEAIATGDPGAVFAKLAEIPGGYGESLAELYRRQMDLGAAVERLAAAEARLAAARKAEEASGVKLSKQAREYNKLAQAGASPEILAAKLAEVKASYAALVAAREETEAAEEAKDAAAEQVKWQKEQVRLQERLLKQLIEMGQAFADLLPKPGDEDDPFVIPPIEWPEGFLVPIDTAFEELKNSIRAKFAALFADLKAQWEESGVLWWMAKVKETWEQSGLKEWWDEFWADVKEGGLAYALGELWDKFLEGHTVLEKTFNWLSRIKEKFSSWVTDAVWPWLLTQWDKLSNWWDEKGPGIIKWILGIGDAPYSYKHIWDWVLGEWYKWEAWWEEDGPLIVEAIEKIGEAIDGLWIWITGDRGWESIWDFADSVFREFWYNITILAEGGMAQLRNYITLGAQIITGDWGGAWETMQRIADTTMDTINRLTDGKFYELIGTVGRFVDKFGGVGLKLGLALLTSINVGLGLIASSVVEFIRSAIEGLRAEKWRFENLGHILMDALRDAIFGKAAAIVNALRDVINRAIQAAKDALGIHSKSKVFFEFGENVAKAFTSGIEDFAHQPAIAVTHMADFTGVTAQAAVGTPKKGYAATPIIIHNHFGRDSIRSDRDVILIADQIQRALELQGVRSRIA
jgi:hypothetical protein